MGVKEIVKGAKKVLKMTEIIHDEFEKLVMIDEDGKPTEEGLASVFEYFEGKTLEKTYEVDTSALGTEDEPEFYNLLEELSELGCVISTK